MLPVHAPDTHLELFCFISRIYRMRFVDLRRSGRVGGGSATQTGKAGAAIFRPARRNSPFLGRATGRRCLYHILEDI
eukprot:364673-Chlamydomonas_euryale.AAC.3